MDAFYAAGLADVLLTKCDKAKDKIAIPALLYVLL